MKLALIGLLVISASIASAKPTPVMPPSVIVQKIKVSRWVEVDLSRPRMGDIGGVEDALYQTVAYDASTGIGYWAACTPPTGYTDFVVPDSPTALMAQEVVQTPSGMWAFKPGTHARTIAYHIYNFLTCAYRSITSLGTSDGPKTIVIREHTPIFGIFGLKEYEIE